MQQEQLEEQKRRQIFTPQQDPVALIVEKWQRAASQQASLNPCHYLVYEEV
jgi:hypothetical protein